MLTDRMYMVLDRHNAPTSYSLSSKTLWCATIHMRANRSAPYVFRSKEVARTAIKNTLELEKREGYKWSEMYGPWRVVPVNVEATHAD
jgi:hypothetical protein